jgi:hypothetical protein
VEIVMETVCSYLTKSEIAVANNAVQKQRGFIQCFCYFELILIPFPAALEVYFLMPTFTAPGNKVSADEFVALAG